MGRWITTFQPLTAGRRNIICGALCFTTVITTVTSTTTSNWYRINFNATCISRCLVYLAECTVCKKQYVGNANQQLRDRITGHRNNKETAPKSHLVLRGINFNQAFNFVVLSKTSPEKLTDL